MAKIDQVIDGKYRILTEVGRGGMSVVYLAMDTRLNKQWAVKEVSKKKASGSENKIGSKSIVDEANLMKKLDHPSLPRIVDIIDTPDTLYIVEDYIEGETLLSVLENGPQPQDVVIDWAKQICDVLGYLHAQKPPIVYRDMKPSNVMLNAEGNLKVFDFGIAREYKEENTADTVSLGTKGYAAPEQFGGMGQTDARTDIYGLGATLYHLVTGMHPTEAPYYEMRPIREINPALSGGLENIILKCTQADPNDRYQNCDELMYALENYEKEDTAYRKRQKRKLAGFITSAACFVIGGAVAIAANQLATLENKRDYENLINVTDRPYAETVDSYHRAINTLPYDTRAYIKLLGAYTDGELGDAGVSEQESNDFAALYNKNREGLSSQGTDYLELNFQAGIAYAFSYTGGDGSFRTRVLKAYPYFETVCNSETSSGYRNTPVADSFRIVGDFYKEYVTNTTGVKEPALADYEELLRALTQCVANVDNYSDQSSSYTRLTMYQEVVNLLNSHRKGLAVTGVEQKTVIDLLDSVRRYCDQIPGTVMETQELKEDVLQRIADTKKALERTYKNTDERSEGAAE